MTPEDRPPRAEIRARALIIAVPVGLAIWIAVLALFARIIGWL